MRSERGPGESCAGDMLYLLLTCFTCCAGRFSNDAERERSGKGLKSSVARSSMSGSAFEFEAPTAEYPAAAATAATHSAASAAAATHKGRSLYAASRSLFVASRPRYAASRSLYAASRSLFAVSRSLYAASRPPYAASRSLYATHSAASAASADVCYYCAACRGSYSFADVWMLTYADIFYHCAACRSNLAAKYPFSPLPGGSSLSLPQRANLKADIPGMWPYSNSV
jgi:hypothetical protein